MKVRPPDNKAIIVPNSFQKVNPGILAENRRSPSLIPLQNFTFSVTFIRKSESTRAEKIFFACRQARPVLLNHSFSRFCADYNRFPQKSLFPFFQVRCLNEKTLDKTASPGLP
jgi:hypothetical protein